ncbi:hypothetical protein BJ165DRAFT_1447807 [Panaeolus papilionaceus]|nr:hypothetical protein BJ165DRAFT_1447807 [Panaeolus papilionaceus]
MPRKTQQDSSSVVERIVSFEISSIDKDTFQMTVSSGQKGEQLKTAYIDPMLPSKYPEFNAICNQYIRPGGVPSHGEFTALDDFQARWNEDRAQLQSEVDQMSMQLNLLYNSLLSTVVKLRQTDVYASMCQSLRAPIRNLPSEILANIFYLCIPENKSPRADAAPLDIRRVCKFWNDIVINNGALWNRVRFDIDSRLTPAIVNRIKCGMTMYRSGPKATIPFSLGLFTNATYGENHLHNKIMSLITPHLPHCKHLYLGCTNTNWYRRFGLISPLKLKALESLYINFKETSGNSHMKMTCFMNSPKLKSVTLVLWKSEHIPQFVLPYHQLSSLSVSIRINHADHPTPVSTLEDLVKQCPNLEQLEVDFQQHHPDRAHPLHVDNAASPPEPSALSSLRKFRLITDFAGYLVDFVKAFELPSLTSLSVDALHPFQLSHPDGPPLAQLFQPQGTLSFFSGLVELELLHVSLSQNEIQNFLETATRLEKLTMMNLLPSSPGWGRDQCLVENDSLLELLAVPSSPSPDGQGMRPLGPRLANLHLFHAAEGGTVTSPRFPVEKLAAVAKTRRTWLALQSCGDLLPPRLYIHITFETGCKEILPVVVQSLKEEGVSVSADLSSKEFQKNIDRSYHYANSIHPSYPL